MHGKIVLITGANGGLGNAVTKQFLDAGASVIGASRSIQASDFPHPRFSAFPVDFTDSGAVGAMTAQIVGRQGKIDALVHLVGGFTGGLPVAETTDAAWQKMRDANLTSAFYMLRAVIPHMRQAGGGRIVAIGSLTASEPRAGLGAYVTFKTALVTLVRTVALENAAAGITANVVLPGTMDTPANRAAQPNADFSKWVPTDDVARLILWLAADEAAQVNGVAFPVPERTA